MNIKFKINTFINYFHSITYFFAFNFPFERANIEGPEPDIPQPKAPDSNAIFLLLGIWE